MTPVYLNPHHTKDVVTFITIAHIGCGKEDRCPRACGNAPGALTPGTGLSKTDPRKDHEYEIT